MKDKPFLVAKMKIVSRWGKVDARCAIQLSPMMEIYKVLLFPNQWRMGAVTEQLDALRIYKARASKVAVAIKTPLTITIDRVAGWQQHTLAVDYFNLPQ